MSIKNLREALVVHDTLNPDLFDIEKTILSTDTLPQMWPEVREKLLLIAEYFRTAHLNFELPVVDIHMVGSNASYNYSPSSDIDLHLVTNFEMFDGLNQEMIQILFNLEKSSFNSSYDIKVKGREVEVYVEDIKSTAVSNGIYSVLRDKWVKFPSKIVAQTPDTSIDLNKAITRIDDILSTGSVDAIQMEINNLYLMRKNAIDVEGEYGYGNQLFKDIRASGKLAELKDTYKKLKSNELSLEEFDFGELY